VEIKEKVDELQTKYKIDTQNCVALYYRGTDKISETKIDTFDSYYQKLNEIITENKTLQILIQSDSAPFIDFMKEKCKNMNCIIIHENKTSYKNIGIHNENHNKKKDHANYYDIQYLFSTFLIFSKCKYIVCGSSNGSVSMMFYRGNANNVFQNLNRTWL
jgi:hypothetical protein